MGFYARRKNVLPAEIYYKDEGGFHPVNIEVMTKVVPLHQFNFLTSVEYVTSGEDTVIAATGYKITRVGEPVAEIGLYETMIEKEAVLAMDVHIRKPYIFPGGDA